MAAPEVIPSRLSAALIGGGFIGPVHAEAIRRIGVKLVGLLGSSPDRARPLARKLGVERVYRDFDELLEDSSAQVVHVASPNAAHFEQVRRLLESGRHVLCEKPLATKAADSRALRDLARALPRQAAAVNYNIRYYPLCHEMRDRVARGDIGRVLSATGSYTQDWLLYADDYNWRVEADGGTNLRAVADIGTHWMDLAQFVVGQPIRSVMADLATFHRERLRPIGQSETFAGRGDRVATRPVSVVTEDYGAILFRMAGDVRGAFHVSQSTAGRKNRLVLEVAGTEGSLAWNSEQPEDLWRGRRGGPNESLMRDPALLSPSAGAISDYPGGHAEGFPDTFKQLALAVYRWVDAGANEAPSFPTFDDGHREILLCEAIAQSAREGVWIEAAGD
jgi:predicted dehydrogenase